MKKAISLLLMGFVGLIGTYAWAGSAREDSVARLQSSVEVLQAIMATPDKEFRKRCWTTRSASWSCRT